MRLLRRDLLNTALERGGQGDIARTITSLCDVGLSLQEQSRILAQMLDVSVSIVSLTVTEKAIISVMGRLICSIPILCMISPIRKTQFLHQAISSLPWPCCAQRALPPLAVCSVIIY